jgi:two-component system CheB/CheR fusion protein
VAGFIGIRKPNPIDLPLQMILARLRSEFQPLARGKVLAFTVVQSSATIHTDPRLFERMLQNLVSNAIKYTKTGKVLIGARRREGALRIEVWDTGAGIPQDQLDAIFEEYHRVDTLEGAHGTGLGLAVVKRLSAVLEHPVAVRSVPGRGSVFAVEVPLAPRAAAEPASSGTRSSAPPPKRGERVLLVEDRRGLRESLRLLLDTEGYDVDTAEAARDLVQEGGREPDIVIADRNLPGGTSGIAVSRELRAGAGRELPVIILTGDVSPATAHEIVESGFDHLTKPVQPDRLLEKIETLTRGSSGPAPRSREVAAPSKAASRPAVARGTVWVVDDEASIRDALCLLLETAGHEVRDFETAEDFLAAYAPAASECLILDISLPGISGLELLQQLRAAGRELPVIVITGRQDVPIAVRAMRVGAEDFLEKPVPGDRLVEALDRALDRAARRAVEHAERAATEERLARLTPREREVLDLIVEGLNTKEIARRLDISPRTTESHRARVMDKIGARSIAELVRFALGQGA